MACLLLDVSADEANGKGQDDYTKRPKIIWSQIPHGTVIDGWVLYSKEEQDAYPSETRLLITPEADFWITAVLERDRTIEDRKINNKSIVTAVPHSEGVDIRFATIEQSGDFAFILVPSVWNKKSPMFLAEVYYKDHYIKSSYLLDGYRLINSKLSLPEDMIGSFPTEEYKKVLMKLLRASKGEITLPVDREYAKRQKKRMEKTKRDREERDPRYADRKWHEYLMFNVGNKIAEKGLIPRERIPGEKAVIPNVNEGLYLQTKCTDRLAKLLEKASGCQVGAISGDGAKPIRGSMTFRLGPHDDGRYVYMWVAHAYSYYQAGRCMYTMTSFLDNRPKDRCGIGKDGKLHALTPDELLALLEPAGDAVGEQCLRLRASVDDEGLPVKGSEKRSIYFTRGNTAVALFTDEPDINVLPLARAIDKLLVEGMRKAGEPLTKEQDYLKEEKKQK